MKIAFNNLSKRICYSFGNLLGFAFSSYLTITNFNSRDAFSSQGIAEI